MALGALRGILLLPCCLSIMLCLALIQLIHLALRSGVHAPCVLCALDLAARHSTHRAAHQRHVTDGIHNRRHRQPTASTNLKGDPGREDEAPVGQPAAISSSLAIISGVFCLLQASGGSF